MTERCERKVTRGSHGSILSNEEDGQFTELQPEGTRLQAQHEERKDQNQAATLEGLKCCGVSGCRLDM